VLVRVTGVEAWEVMERKVKVVLRVVVGVKRRRMSGMLVVVVVVVVRGGVTVMVGKEIGEERELRLRVRYWSGLVSKGPLSVVDSWRVRSS